MLKPFDLLIVADEPEIERAAAALRETGARVEAVQTDLATDRKFETHQ